MSIFFFLLDMLVSTGAGVDLLLSHIDHSGLGAGLEWPATVGHSADTHDAIQQSSPSWLRTPP